MPGIVRAGLALVAPGRRQHHFLPSDRAGLPRAPEWCLIDAYDDLPLNDCIRTGRMVAHPTPQSLAEAYPALAKAQVGTRIRSVIAAPLEARGDRLGGMLMYLDRSFAHGSEVGPELATELAGVVADGLVAVRPSLEWPAVEGYLLPADESAPAIARKWVLEQLTRLPTTPTSVDAALVCTSELVTNIVMHTGRPSVIGLEREGDDVVLRLHHLTDPAPRNIAAYDDELDPLRVSGHGLELVEALSVAWGQEDRDGITSAWCRIRA
jgi:anti-sigma regulatory factor (Ser/Thr protein kinase)